MLQNVEHFLIRHIVTSVLPVMTFTGKIICGVFERKMMGQSFSTPDDAAVCEEEEEEEQQSAMRWRE